MDETIAQTLLALNQCFYREFAPIFAETRSVGDTALRCILPYIPPAARVLDVGCGNGRLAALLDRERPGARYTGLDFVEEMVAIAQSAAGELREIEAHFYVADIAVPGWSASFRPFAPFDVVAALAVLHHIPGLARRALVLREVASLLDVRGCLILSVWQFLENARMQRKLVPWKELGIPEECLEPGDYLLDWKRGGRGLRYCHLVDEAELGRLAAESGLRIIETFRAGGREGDLSLFAVLCPAAKP